MSNPNVSVIDVCDYIITKMSEGDVRLSTLKLHKLLYYVQAWHLAFYNGERCFNSEFQAWVHGPVNRTIYDRFKNEKSMYSRVQMKDVSPDFDLQKLPENIKRHVDSVLEIYAEFTDDQLEAMTHEEAPWQEARKDYRPSQRCEVVISDKSMTMYYGARLN